MISFPRKISRSQDERGAAAVEFALISVALFVIVFGIITFGLFFSRYEVYQSAAREGARFAAVRPQGGAAPTTPQVLARVREAANPYGSLIPATVSVSPVCSTGTKGQPITVQWHQSFDDIIQLPFVPDMPDLTIKGVFRCEG
jgi:Flp pilus assembly protein TadG